MEAATLATPEKTNTIPKIGSAFAGGIFAGIVAGQDGQPDYYLVHATVDFEIDDINWQGAIEAAKTPINSFHDWSLPNRHEARLLAINSPDSFDKGTWYWTATQYADDDGYAWMQTFDYGSRTPATSRLSTERVQSADYQSLSNSIISIHARA